MNPTDWLDTVSGWAPYVLGALAITTTLVHGLRPIARAVQRWTITTAATWDDGPARWCADRLDWLAGALDTVLGAVPHVTIAPAPKTKGGSKGASSLVLLLAVALGGSVASGCSAGPQLPVTTVPMSIACSWTINTGQGEQQEPATVDSAHGTGAQASAVIADSDCLVDRSSAEAAAATTGNDNRGARVDAELPVHVSATGE